MKEGDIEIAPAAAAATDGVVLRIEVKQREVAAATVPVAKVKPKTATEKMEEVLIATRERFNKLK